MYGLPAPAAPPRAHCLSGDARVGLGVVALLTFAANATAWYIGFVDLFVEGGDGVGCVHSVAGPPTTNTGMFPSNCS